MILIEIPDNPNCPPVDLRVFHDLKPPVRVSRVRLERLPGHPAWYDLTGWTLAHTICPAWAQPVDDSGEGVALLVGGGDAGLRLRPAGGDGLWQLGDPQQWGEPFLLVADLHDVQLVEAQSDPTSTERDTP